MALGEGTIKRQGSTALRGEPGGNLAMSDSIGQPSVMRGGSGSVSRLSVMALTGGECANKIATAAEVTGLAAQTDGTVNVAPVNQGDTQRSIR